MTTSHTDVFVASGFEGDHDLRFMPSHALKPPAIAVVVIRDANGLAINNQCKQCLGE